MKPLLALSLVSAASLVGAMALAQGVGNPGDIARAKVLFDQAVGAMKRKDWPVACPKLEEVVRLVPDGLGARIELGKCYEGSGRLASAWAMYTKAEGLATQPGQEERRKEAQQRAARVKPRLATLTIVVPDAIRQLPGLVVTSDGAAFGPAEWSVAVPVDRGRRVVAATATGRKRWEKAVDIEADGGAITVTIEPLERSAEPAVGQPEPAPAGAPPPSSTGSLRRTLGIAGLAAGGAGLALGAVMGGLFVAKRGDLLKSCPGGICRLDRKATLDPQVSAYHAYGAVSTAGFIAGGALAAAGVVLFVTAPSPATTAGAFTLHPAIAPGWAGVAGRF